MLRWLGRLAAMGLGASSAFAARSPGHDDLAVGLWLGAWALMLLSTPPAAARTGPPAAGRRTVLAAGAVLLVFGALLRLFGLAEIPQNIHGDEGEVALEGLRLRDDPGRPLFGYGWYYLPNPGFWLQGIGFDLFGRDLASFRAGGALLGIASLAGGALAAGALFGRRVGLLALAPLVAYHWHLHLSRTSVTYIQPALFATWAVALLALGRHRKSARMLLLCGGMAGLGCLGYPGGRIVPVLLGVFLLGELLLGWRRLGANLRDCAHVAAGFVLAILPAVPMFVQEGNSFGYRTQQVVIWAPANRQHLAGVVGTDSLPGIALRQLVRSLRIFLPLGDHDASVQYGFTGSFLDPYLLGFALLGLALCFARIRRPEYRLVLLWFWLTLVLGLALTLDAPFMPRAGALATLPYTFAALGATAVWDLLGRWFGVWGKRFGAVALAALYTASVLWNLDAYFRVYPQQRPPNDGTVLARQLASLEPDVAVCNVLVPRIFWGYGPIRFLNYERAGKDTPDLAAEIASPSAAPRVFVIESSRPADLEALQHAFPSGRLLTEKPVPGILLFLAPGSGP